MDRAASDLSWLGGEEQQVAGETEEADLCNCVSSLCGYVPIPFEVGDDGTDKVLVVCEQVEDIDSTGVTYNGLSLTLAEAATGGDKEAKIWYLLDPPLGVANVVISYSAADTVLKTAEFSFSSGWTRRIRLAGRTSSSIKPRPPRRQSG